MMAPAMRVMLSSASSAILPLRCAYACRYALMPGACCRYAMRAMLFCFAADAASEILPRLFCRLMPTLLAAMKRLLFC